MPTITASESPGLRADNASDEALMRRLGLGDVNAFDALYRRYYPLAASIARRYVRDAVAAEDIAQECFMSLWKNRARYRREQGAPRTWLMAIAHNRAIDATRRAKARPQVAATLEDAASTAASADDIAAEAESRERSRRTLAAVAALPDHQREVVGLSAYGGLTHAEIAARTGAPLGTVKGRSRLAMAKLRAEFAA